MVHRPGLGCRIDPVLAVEDTLLRSRVEAAADDRIAIVLVETLTPQAATRSPVGP